MDNEQSTPRPSTSSSERFVAPPFSRLNSARSLRPHPSPHPPPAGSCGPSTPRVLSNSNASTPRSQACVDSGRVNDFQRLYDMGRAEKAAIGIRPATASRSPVARGLAQSTSTKFGTSEGSCPRRPSSAAPFPTRTPNGPSPPHAGVSNSSVPSFATSTAAQQQYDGGLHSVLSAGAAGQLRTMLLGLSSSLILMCDSCQQIIDDMPRGWLYSVPSNINSLPSSPSPLEGSTRMRPLAVSVLADIKYLRRASKGELMEALLQVVRDLSSGGGGGVAAAASSTRTHTTANSRRVLSARGPRRDIAAAKGMLFPTSSPQPQRPHAGVVRDHQSRSSFKEAKQTPPPPPPANSGQDRPLISSSFVLDGMLGALQHCEILILALAALHLSATRLVADFKGQEGIPHRHTHVNVQTLSSSSSEKSSSCGPILALDEAFEKGQGFINDIAKVIDLCIVRWPRAGAAAASSHTTDANVPQSSGSAASASDNCVEAEGVLIARGVLAEVAAAFEARRVATITSIAMREKVYSSSSLSCAADKGPRRGGTELESHHSTFVTSVRRRLSASLPSVANAEHEDGNVDGQTGGHVSSFTKKAVADELAKSHLSSSALDRLLPLYGNTQLQPPPPARDAFTTSPLSRRDSGEKATVDHPFLRFSAHHTASDRAAHTYLSKRVLFLRRARYSSLLAWEEMRRLFNEKRGSGGDVAPADTESPSGKRDSEETKYTGNRVHPGTGQSKGAGSRRPETAGSGVERGFTHAVRGHGTAEAEPPPSIFAPFVRGGQTRTPSAARTQSLSASVNTKIASVILKDKHLVATIQSDANRWVAFEAVEAKGENVKTTPDNLHLPPPWPHAVLSSVANVLGMEYDAKSGALTKTINRAVSSPVTTTTVSHDSFLRVNEYLKVLQRRWHPDRFINRCAHLSDQLEEEEGMCAEEGRVDSSETVVAKATRISQTINALRDGLSRALFVK